MSQTEESQPNPASSAREGLFDAQLSLFFDGPAPLDMVVKRNGRPAPFDKAKVAEAIHQAALSVGDDDATRAQHLASAVTIYLTKTRSQECPSVDEIAASVERVLVEMGHVRTARAYVRYRERRQRQRAAQARGRHSQSGVFVRTSAETLEPWDRSRIVEALVRETGLARPEADSIASDVEATIAAAQLKEPASAVIRELVGAKLIERGLIEHGRRHMRLGVPLYDADRIIRGPHVAVPCDPESTGRVLAEAVKREYALTQVFSPEVADAHARGELHLHDLGEVDRLHAATLSPESLMRFGIGLSQASSFSSPPHFAETLLAQMATASQLWRRHCHRPVAWDAVNIFLAPFLEGMDPSAIQQFARMLVYEFAYRAVEEPQDGPEHELHLSWSVPARLKRVDAIGPGGAPTERLYGDYAHLAQQLAWAVLEVFREHGARDVRLKAPVPMVLVSPAFFKAEGHERFLRHAAETASTHGNVAFQFERDALLLDYCEPWEPREVVAGRVTLNLARIARMAKDRKAFSTGLSHAAALAMQGHADKKRFLEDLLAQKDAGPLALLAMSRGGRPAADMQRARYYVGVTGLHECARALGGHEACGSLACEVLEELRRYLDGLEDECDVRGVLAETRDLTVARRFAALDARDVGDPETAYTPGVRSGEPGLTPFARAQAEGLLHEVVEADARMTVAAADGEAGPDSIAAFIQQTYHHTSCRGVLFGHAGPA